MPPHMLVNSSPVLLLLLHDHLVVSVRLVMSSCTNTSVCHSSTQGELTLKLELALKVTIDRLMRGAARINAGAGCVNRIVTYWLRLCKS